ncbi:hypothetical protein JXA88_11050, partial [Candidatus Fermentibacteria bacterium]|nr:hypothetical protein [Candidatus Fermentibacteria bacterium]
WRIRPEDAARIRVQLVQKAVSPGEFVVVDSLAPTATSMVVNGLPNGITHQYRIVLIDVVGRSIPSVPTDPVAACPQWFNREKANLLVIALLLSTAVLIFIERAKRGQQLFIRRIAGLEAVSEAVGRATEMGRAVLFVPGINDMDDVQTLAGLSILQTIARTTAEYDTPLNVPVSRSLVLSAARETVKEAYLAAGRPDAYREDCVHYITDAQFGYVAAVDGIMVRERPATAFYLGAFFAESLILAETGNSIGAIQVAGTAMPAQLPFFVAACDYTLIGEELFAASAYLSQEPRMLGSLKGQDVGKLLAILFIAAGAIAETAASLAGGTGPATTVAAFLHRLFAMNF